MTICRSEVANTPYARVGAVLAAFRAAPAGAELELLHGIIAIDDTDLVEAVVVRIDGLTYALTIEEVETCAATIEIGLRTLPDLFDGPMMQLAEILRFAQHRRSEGSHGDHHIN